MDVGTAGVAVATLRTVMQVPTEITFHGIDHTDPVEASILQWVARLEQVHEGIKRCEVVIGQPRGSHRRGRHYEVNLVLEVLGGEIATTDVGHQDIYVAIAHAFRIVRRQLSS